MLDNRVLSRLNCGWSPQNVLARFPRCFFCKLSSSVHRNESCGGHLVNDLLMTTRHAMLCCRATSSRKRLITPSRGRVEVTVMTHNSTPDYATRTIWFGELHRAPVSLRHYRDGRVVKLVYLCRGGAEETSHRRQFKCCGSQVQLDTSTISLSRIVTRDNHCPFGHPFHVTSSELSTIEMIVWSSVTRDVQCNFGHPLHLTSNERSTIRCTGQLMIIWPSVTHDIEYILGHPLHLKSNTHLVIRYTWYSIIFLPYDIQWDLCHSATVNNREHLTVSLLS